MVVVPEETIEAEQGYDYGYGEDYSYGIPEVSIADVTQAIELGQGGDTISGAGDATIDDATHDLTLTQDQERVEYELNDETQGLSLSQEQESISGKGDATISDATHSLLLGQGRDSIGFTDWVVAGEVLRVVGATLTPTELSIDVRARTQAERDALDTLDAEAGAVDTRERADGTVDGLDRAGGNNTFTVYPPVDLQPPRINREWVVDDVERDRASADTQSTLATVTFVGQETRDPATGLSESGGTDAWTFHFGGFGTIATPAVSGLEQGEVTALTITMTPTQAELFETTAAATAGAVASEVPDGETFTRDTTPNDRQTVTITPPSSASDPTPSAGEYVVTGWESVGSAGGAYRVTVEISSRYEPR